MGRYVLFHAAERAQDCIAIALANDAIVAALNPKDGTLQLKAIALAALAVIALCAATFSVSTQASAQNSLGNKIHQCVYPYSRAIHFCTIEEYNRLKNVKAEQAKDRRRQQQKEIDAEARAFAKMKQERESSAPTKEHCFMKNGKLECKPAP